MLTKLVYRNAKRSLGDYLIYILTMVLVTSLMFSFNYMIFSKDVQELYSEAGIMAVMIGIATFFVVLIVIWLVHYMVKFIAQKRSREFATYLLIGFRKGQIAKLFLKENMMIGLFSFVIGIVPGIFLQQVMTSIIYAVVGNEYGLKLNFNIGAFLLTAGVYAGAYVLALFGNKRRFKKMNIHDMMYAERKNEKMNSGNKSGKQWMFFVSVLYMSLFAVILYTGNVTEGNVYPLIFGLVLSVYMLFIGLSAFLVRYIKRGKGSVWKNGNIFVLRQLSSKIKTMQFTLGTLTVLFMTALVGCSCALMLNTYQTTQLEIKWPFDVAVYHSNADYNFAQEQKIIESSGGISDSFIYRVYEDGSNAMNQFLTEHNKSINVSDMSYFKYDTFLKLSDYNRLRKMLGYQEVTLKQREYAIQMVSRLKNIGDEFSKKTIQAAGADYSCGGIYTEGFEQSGHNGADYILVLPDEAIAQMHPYYSLLMVNLKGSPDGGLEKNLNEINESFSDDWGIGTEIISVNGSAALVKEIDTRELKSIMSAIIFPLFYIGLVFVCVALTVLAVQQLSDMGKQRYRYGILKQLGMREKERNGMILKQLGLYYFCPFAASILLSVGIAGYLSYYFNLFSGVPVPVWSYLGIAALLLGAAYLIYFSVTYIEFKRNIEKRF